MNVALALLTVTARLAQDPQEPIVIRGKREEGVVAESPSVWVVPREEIEREAALSREWGRILARTVSGLSISTESMSNAGQTLRGQMFTVLIDGVPQSAWLRNGQRDLRIIDPSAVDRVEVIRGPSLRLGSGIVGGAINFVTRTAAKEEDPLGLSVEGSGGMSLSHPEDSLRGKLATTVHGKHGPVDYVLNAAYEVTGSFFDSDGDRIPPDPHGQGGFADTGFTNLFGKVGADLSENHRVQAGVNYYGTRQETAFGTVSGIYRTQKTRAVQGFVPGLDPGTRNLSLNVDYTGRAPASGTRWDADLFHQEYATRFTFNPFFPGGGQSFISSDKWGGRAGFELPIPFRLAGAIRVGADFLNDRTRQRLEDGRTLVPWMSLEHAGVYIEFDAALGESVDLRGGLRQEFVDLRVDSFTTLFGGNFVQGGPLYYDPTLVSVGASARVAAGLEVSASYAQGFTVADLGSDLITTTAASVQVMNPAGQRTDNFELEVRRTWAAASASVAGFLSLSEEGITFGGPPAFGIRRLPERVYGVETAASLRTPDGWTVVGSLTWMDGDQDAKRDGAYNKKLPNYRVPPLKLTATLEHETLPGWRNRFEVLYSAYRDPVPGSAAFGEGRSDDLVLVGFSSSFPLLGGVARISFDNLLNQRYFPTVATAAQIGRFYTQGEGMTMTLSYKHEW